MIGYEKIRCGISTCRAYTMRPTEIPLHTHLDGIRWEIQQIDGHLVPLCERCKE